MSQKSDQAHKAREARLVHLSEFDITRKRFHAQPITMRLPGAELSSGLRGSSFSTGIFQTSNIARRGPKISMQIAVTRIEGSVAGVEFSWRSLRVCKNG